MEREVAVTIGAKDRADKLIILRRVVGVRPSTVIQGYLHVTQATGEEHFFRFDQVIGWSEGPHEPIIKKEAE